MIKEHGFTPIIRHILVDEFGHVAEEILQTSEILQYLNVKTISATRGSKARGAFGNIYAIYVLIEDYVQRDFHINGNYENAAGAKFSHLFKRQRELPFGSKLQNHALNHRLNQEFRKYFPLSKVQPILRNTETHEYWINEHLLRVNIAGQVYNIAQAILKIINAYVDTKQQAFTSFINTCQQMQHISEESPDTVLAFIGSLLRPTTDARIFEIASYAILKTYYRELSIFWGWQADDLEETKLMLYKTGRTNANDGGIDFVMKPLGRFFQVTETLDVRKYFLDIDKVQKYPITFVVKTEMSVPAIKQKIREQAQEQYPVRAIVERYMACIEEVINIHILTTYLQRIVEMGHLNLVIQEIVKHSQVEFDLQG